MTLQFRVMRESLFPDSAPVPIFPGAKNFATYDDAEEFCARAKVSWPEVRVWIESRTVSDWQEFIRPFTLTQQREITRLYIEWMHGRITGAEYSAAYKALSDD